MATSSERAPFGIATTNRYVSVGGENELFREHGVDGHGSVELVDYMGGDPVVERIATAGHGRSILPTRPSRTDLFRYLVARGIRQPFAGVQLKFSIESPIDVALSLVYEPSASVNEYSGRYSNMLETSFTPSTEAIADMLSEKDSGLRMKRAELLRARLVEHRGATVADYQRLLKLDMTRELARTILGTDNDTRYYWKINLASLADFVIGEQSRLQDGGLTLGYVNQIASLARAVAPDAWDALVSTHSEADIPLSLPMPIDDEVVDGDLSPASWRPASTRRVVVPSLEEQLFVPRETLDHGQLQAVDYLGNDSSLAEAARTSYGTGTKKLQDDHALVRSLIRDSHTSPIEMAELAVEMKAPLFVDPRQLGRHRTLNHHGFMGMVPLGSEVYMPAREEFKYQDRKDRQGRGKTMEDGDREEAMEIVRRRFALESQLARTLREEGAPESIVRSVKGVGFYTRQWRTGNAHNWNRFNGLRDDAHAQMESRAYARPIGILQQLQTPVAYQANRDNFVEGVRFSKTEIDFIRAKGGITPDMPLDSPDFYEGSRFLIVKKDKEGQPLLDEQGKPQRELGREGTAFANKLRRFFEA